MNAALAKLEPQPEPSNDAALLSMIARAASDPAVDIDKMERLLAMHERAVGRQAEQAFNDAMNRAQARMGRVGTDAVNPQTKSSYATYSQLDRALRPIYTEEGFALSFGTEADAPAEHVRVICHVSHAAGHSRSYQADMPVDGKGAKGNDVMTKTHAMGSGMSYGMRYLLKMIFNVAIGQDDDDGNGAGRDLSAEEKEAEEKAHKEAMRARRKAVHDEAFGAHSESIAFIKERLAAGDGNAARAEWALIGQTDQMALWVAPTHGGCLTTAEREQLRAANAKP